ISTALAFWYFAEQEVDSAVIEVGLGGRLDATNVITPLVSVITSISLEHTYILGNTLAAIAAEKAGIIKQGVPVVSAPQRDEARSVIVDTARKMQAPCDVVDQHYAFESKDLSLAGQVVEIWPIDDPAAKAALPVRLLGAHQAENAATAYATLQAARQAGLEIEEHAIQQGFAQATWPGRFEVMQLEPAVVIDCAHNPYSAQALVRTLDEYFPGKEIILLFGVSEDKDAAQILVELLPRVNEVITVQSLHPRAMPAEPLAEIAAGVGLQARAVPIIAQALEQALETASQQAVVLVTGSVFVAAAARIAWQESHLAAAGA
ncbi:MAG: Mur ligase family protein, partial [Anaerolineae bacterium]|nr:Mur ligase family protein [Anaerolineae bacterium]